MDDFDFEDLFGGGGGSQAQGTATTTGAGDGGKNNAITNWLSTLTGAYNAVTGSGTRGGPAPVSTAITPAPATNWTLYGAIAVGVLVLVFLVAKR